MSANRWMDQTNVVSIFKYSIIYYSAIKRNEVLICCNMDEPWKHARHKGQTLYHYTHMKDWEWGNSEAEGISEVTRD